LWRENIVARKYCGAKIIRCDVVYGGSIDAAFHNFDLRILAVSPGPVDTGRLETMLKKRATLPEWGGQESAWQV
jgi:hypothetical protein